MAPSHAGLTPDLLAKPGFRDGVVVPLPDAVGFTESGPEAAEQIEVNATRAHLGKVPHENEPAGLGAPLEPRPSDDDLRPPDRDDRPPLIRFSPPAARHPVPPVDAYSLRLVSGRRLYDAGVMVQRSPALAELVRQPAFRVNPHDLDQIGVESGSLVRLTSPRGSLVTTVVADPDVARGSASLDINLPGDGAADLIDAAQPVTEVRLESIGDAP
ncbi:MAG: hypothetical protein M3144_08575 [Actinomycetota bacterium]|nr:hypothetical protein [Actinomycetota bacterium]